MHLLTGAAEELIIAEKSGSVLCYHFCLAG